MRRLVSIGLVAASVWTLGPSAFGAPNREGLIRPGIGIGNVRLGMTLTQVKRVMGTHDRGWSEERSFGRRYLELDWDRGPADYFSVGLLGQRGALRVVAVTTTRPSERLTSGIGPGSSTERLRRAVPGLRCRMVSARGGSYGWKEYVLTAPSGAQTAFAPGRYRLGVGTSPSLDARRIAWVMVRRPDYRTDLASRPCPR
jgi:hypothetical protein